MYVLPDSSRLSLSVLPDYYGLWSVHAAWLLWIVVSSFCLIILGCGLPMLLTLGCGALPATPDYGVFMLPDYSRLWSVHTA